MKKRAWKMICALVAFSIITGMLFACKKEEESIERKSKVYYQYFDTVSTIYSFSGDSESEFYANAEVFEQELSICHKLFDIYNVYEGVVNLKNINDSAGGEACKVDERIIELLEFSIDMYEKTNGAVNIAMGAVLEIWDRYRSEGVSLPSDQELISAQEHCDISKIEINRQEGTVRLLDPLMSLDVGAIAKGFAIDWAVNALRERGVSSYAVDVGGNLFAIGAKADGAPFNTGIENPDGGDYPAYISISDGAVATSGDYQRFYTVGGERYHHIINKDTLYPSNYHRSVSVYSYSAALSDALSTALFNTESYEAARDIIQRVGGVREVVFIEAYGRVERIVP